MSNVFTARDEAAFWSAYQERIAEQSLNHAAGVAQIQADTVAWLDAQKAL